jgi:hypothetical protein
LWGRCASAGILASVWLGGLGCSSEDSTQIESSGATGGVEPSPAPEGPVEGSTRMYVTSTIVFNNDGQNTYVSLLPNLDTQNVDLRQAREFSGWSGIWGHQGKLFVSDGESPEMTRFAVAADGAMIDEGKLSFFNAGAQFADSVFVGSDKAYVFADDGIVWNSQSLAITGSFALPLVSDRAGGMTYSGLGTGRGLVVRGNRAYVAASWANWEEYAVSEDSLIIVIDTDTDQVIATLSAPCPYLDVGTLDDAGNVYFSNWVYSLGPTLLDGKKPACAVRLRPGEDQLDPDWSLTFAEVTGGREAAALRFVGGRKALISVYHDEEATIDANTDPASLADSAHWRFWLLDLDTLAAAPIPDIGAHAGGFATARIDGRTFLMVPSEDYASTSVYELSVDLTAVPRWSVSGWATELFALR